MKEQLRLEAMHKLNEIVVQVREGYFAASGGRSLIEHLSCVQPEAGVRERAVSCLRHACISHPLCKFGPRPQRCSSTHAERVEQADSKPLGARKPALQCGFEN